MWCLNRSTMMTCVLYLVKLRYILATRLSNETEDGVHRIHYWQSIADDYSRGKIILGNGASIAISENFLYDSLFSSSLDRELISPDIQQLFSYFDTRDFELILRLVWHASKVNSSLGISDDRTYQAYINVRDYLIQSVRDVHPSHAYASEGLLRIYDFLSHFDIVLSLNYDLIVYWAITFGLRNRRRHALKDCFVNNFFQSDWRRFQSRFGNQSGSTLVFYPHGNLALFRDVIDREFKHPPIEWGPGLLDSILDFWESGEVIPLFVCEGTKEQKVASIQSSYYLSTVYREVLTYPNECLVIYGWGIGEQDEHILMQLRDSGVRRVAISVRNSSQGYCDHARSVIRRFLGYHVEVYFFEADSPGCWVHR